MTALRPDAVTTRSPAQGPEAALAGRSRPIVYVAADDPTDGAPHQAMAALWLAAKGYRISVLAPQQLRSRREWRTPLATLPATPLGHGRVLPRVRLVLALLRLRLRYRRAALYYVQGRNNCPSAWLALIGVSRRRIIYHMQDLLEPGHHRFWEFFERRLIRRAEWLITNEVNRARFLKSHYRLPEVLVVPTLLPRAWPVPLARETYRERLLGHLRPAPQGPVRLICVGGAFSAPRCSPALLQAAQQLSGDYVLYFSDATGDPTRDAVARAGLGARSILLPKLAYDEMLAYMGACDVGILLYPDDGIHYFYQSPGRLSEYLRSGLPILASAFPSMELLVLKHDLGRVCDPTSPAAIAAAIRALCAVDDASAERRRQRLRRTATRELAYDRHAPVLEGVIERAARATAPAPGRAAAARPMPADRAP